jgi:dephospho-CoA kinase
VKRIAIVGGIGSGKSTVCHFLETEGFPVFDADDVAREIVNVGQPAFLALVDAFGVVILDTDGSLNRRALADIVFSDETARERLNRITHKRIIKKLQDKLTYSKSSVVFVALPLFEDEHRRQLQLDEVWLVQTNKSIIEDRLQQSRQMTLGDVNARMEAQKAISFALRNCDVEIDNNGSVSELQSTVRSLITIRGLHV